MDKYIKAVLKCVNIKVQKCYICTAEVTV